MPTADQIRAERVRSIDQVKRLYAVVMGYGVTTCFSNIYACAKVLNFDLEHALLPLIAQGFVFVSLVALFYLGAERMMDARYLSENSPVPTPKGLLFDLAALGATAGWLVILADSFPVAPSAPFGDDPDGVRQAAAFAARVVTGQANFTHNLLVLYTLDLIFLMGQIIRLSPRPSDPKRDRTLKAHLVWFLINAICLSIFVFYTGDWLTTSVAIAGFSLNGLTCGLVLVHFFRFVIDFNWTFEFYYPTDKLP